MNHATPHRAELAKQAWEMFKPGTNSANTLAKASPSAMRNLLAEALSATVVEEVQIHLAYQGARKVLPDEATDALQKGIDKALADVRGDEARIEALRTWLGFVVRLHRAAYEKNAHKGGRHG